MAILQVIASSSAGNAYAIRAGRHILLVELGVEWKRILRGINYRVSDVSGAIVSHSHGDHLRPSTLKAALLNGIPVHGPSGIDGVSPLAPKSAYRIGPFSVTPLTVPHNVECYAYRIDAPDNNGSILFVTDATDFPYHVKGTSHLIIEANYCEGTIAEALERGSKIRSHPENHLSLESALKIATRHNDPPLRNIVCVHLSQNNSNPDEIASKMHLATSAPVHIAEPGMEIPLSLYEF